MFIMMELAKRINSGASLMPQEEMSLFQSGNKRLFKLYVKNHGLSQKAEANLLKTNKCWFKIYVQDAVLYPNTQTLLFQYPSYFKYYVKDHLLSEAAELKLFQAQNRKLFRFYIDQHPLSPKAEQKLATSGNTSLMKIYQKRWNCVYKKPH